jgi:hypothetical protein
MDVFKKRTTVWFASLLIVSIIEWEDKNGMMLSGCHRKSQRRSAAVNHLRCRCRSVRFNSIEADQPARQRSIIRVIDRRWLQLLPIQWHLFGESQRSLGRPVCCQVLMLDQRSSVFIRATSPPSIWTTSPTHLTSSSWPSQSPATAPNVSHHCQLF